MNTRGRGTGAGVVNVVVEDVGGECKVSVLGWREGGESYEIDGDVPLDVVWAEPDVLVLKIPTHRAYGGKNRPPATMRTEFRVMQVVERTVSEAGRIAYTCRPVVFFPGRASVLDWEEFSKGVNR